MLLHIITAITEPELQSKLSQLLKKPDTIVETVTNHNRLWKTISRQTCDLIVLSRNLIRDNNIDKIQNFRQLPEVPLIVVLSEEENEEDRIRLISVGCDAVLNPKISKKKLGSALNSILDKNILYFWIGYFIRYFF